MLRDKGRRWDLREVPPDLVAGYRERGAWRGISLGQMVADGLGELGHVGFAARSAVRPWSGTLAEVDVAARTLAGAIRARGVGPGDVVVIQLPNWVEAGIAFWAAAYLGAVVVPIVHFYGAKEVGYIVESTSPSVVVSAEQFGHSDHLAMYSELLAGHDDVLWLTVGDSPASALPSGAQRFADLLDPAARNPLVAPAAVDSSAPAVIGFTSGTTSNPKGVIHTHDSLAFEARQLEGMFPQGGPPQITGAPVGHFIGMLNAFIVPLLRTRPVNLVDVWDPAEVLRLMTAEGLGLTGGSTYFLTSLLDHPDFTPEHLALMPFAGLGGSPVPDVVTERATQLGIKVFRSYGSTEHPSVTGCLLDEPEAKRLRTDGHALPEVELRLDDSGEILTRGPDLFAGYTDPALTATVFDADGWYRTGDIGRLDAEGYLTITDRISDVIIRGGENISAREVEELVAKVDGIAEVAVVAAPDARLGERAAAVVRIREGATVPALDDIRDHLREVGLARQKWPESLHVVDDLPRTPSGKVKKFVLREQLGFR